MSFRLLRRLPVLAVLVTGAAGAADIPPAEIDAYHRQPHFRALAVSRAAVGGAMLVRYAFNYDTPRAAADAALASCEESRARSGVPADWSSCALARLGPHRVSGTDADLGIALGRYLEDVLVELRRLLAADDDRSVRTSLNTVLQKSGRFDEADAVLAGLARDGEPLARNALAYHWAEREVRLDAALAYAETAVAAEPGSASFHDTHALVLFRLGRLDEALKASARAVALQDHPIVLDHRGDLLWAAGRRDEAVAAWTRAAEGSADILLRRRVSRKAAAGPDGPPVFE